MKNVVNKPTKCVSFIWKFTGKDGLVLSIRFLNANVVV